MSGISRITACKHTAVRLVYKNAAGAAGENGYFERRHIMRLTVIGKGMEVSEYLETTVSKKASKLERYFRRK